MDKRHLTEVEGTAYRQMMKMWMMKMIMIIIIIDLVIKIAFSIRWYSLER